MLRCRFAMVVTVLLLAACGGTGGKPTGGASPTPPPSITISPTTAHFTSGGAPIAFTASLTGTTVPVTWARAGLGSLSSTSGTTITYKSW